MNATRKKVEELVYKFLDILDPTEQNSNYYKEIFAGLNDKEFVDWFKQDFSIKFQVKLFEIEPKMSQIDKALKLINVPLTERVTMPGLYTNKEGVPVTTNYDALIIYCPIKKVKQFIAKKNSMSTDYTKRDMKSGFLLDHDKNGSTSNREMECLAVMGCNETIRELSSYRADSMNAKSEFYNTINTTGMVYQKDVPVTKDDSLARNQLSTYLLGSHINSNLVNEGNYLPITLAGKGKTARRTDD